MRLRHIKSAEALILKDDICIANFKKQLNFNEIFGNDKPIYLELGMGKGKFIMDNALQNQNINYIGIEKSATIVLKAINSYKKENYEFNNLRFMCENIENLKNIFPPHSIDKIYLNFSDPWPKKRHKTRRLTHRNFLLIYEELLKQNSLIEFKTDNIELFDFSISEIKKSSFKLLAYTYDLHNDSSLNKNNIMTEYETKFSKLGNKICKLIAKI